MLEETEAETPATPDYDRFAERFAENAAILQGQTKTEPLCQHFWQFQLNANHTLIRGCIHCGETYATLVMGDPGDLQWHRIQEPEQTEA